MKPKILLAVLIIAVVSLVLEAAPAEARPTVIEGACAVAYDVCTANCAGLGDEAEATNCRIGCHNDAATCSRDETVTLSSEDYLAFWGENQLSTKAEACHSTTPCPPEYGACASWSSYSACGDLFCGKSTACPLCSDEWPYRCVAAGPALVYNLEQYRVCFSAEMQGCTEYRRVTQTWSCGC